MAEKMDRFITIIKKTDLQRGRKTLEIREEITGSVEMRAMKRYVYKVSPRPNVYLVEQTKTLQTKNIIREEETRRTWVSAGVLYVTLDMMTYLVIFRNTITMEIFEHGKCKTGENPEK